MSFCLHKAILLKDSLAGITHLRGKVLCAGFRPCKLCRPTENAYSAPEGVQVAIKWLNETPNHKISDWELKQHGLSPEAIRRWFVKQYGMTFQAYQRMIRINSAMQALKQGSQVTKAALDYGYESLSGFGYSVKKLTGASPKNTGHTLVIQRITTPLGPMFLGATDHGLCLLEFTDRRMLETELNHLQRHFNTQFIAGENRHTQQAHQELQEYFAGQRRVFDVTLDLPGSPFQRQVWSALQTIPYGETVSYQAQAQRIQNPKAVRAVASANGANRVSIIVPCHRVIGKDGTLTGYGGGLPRKQWLLAHEQGQGSLV